MKKFLTYAIILTIAILTMFVISTNVKAADDLKQDLELEEEKTIVLEEATTITEKVQVKGTKTINLNGQTLTINGESDIQPRLSVEENASLTITGEGTVKAEGNARVVFDVLPGAKLVLESGNYIAKFEDETGGRVVQVRGEDTKAETAVEIGSRATLDADRPILIADGEKAKNIKIDVYGTVKATSYALYVNGKIKDKEEKVPVINVYSGADIQATNGPAVYAAGYAIWNISGGTFTGEEALSIKSGKFNITDGEFIANGEFDETPDANENGVESTGAAISVTNNQAYAGSIDISISNAYVDSENGYSIFEYNTDATRPTVNIEVISGDFHGTKGAVFSANLTEFIKGGNFGGDVESKYVSNTVESEEEDGVTYIGTKHAIEIEKTENGKVVASKEKAIENQLVELDVVPEKGYKLSSLKVYIKGSTEEVYVYENSFMMPNEDVIVQARFEKIPENVSEDITPDDKKDDTPDTGLADIALVATIIGIISLAGIVTVKKYSK